MAQTTESHGQSGSLHYPHGAMPSSTDGHIDVTDTSDAGRQSLVSSIYADPAGEKGSVSRSHDSHKTAGSPEQNQMDVEYPTGLKFVLINLSINLVVL